MGFPVGKGQYVLKRINITISNSIGRYCPHYWPLIAGISSSRHHENNAGISSNNSPFTNYSQYIFSQGTFSQIFWNNYDFSRHKVIVIAGILRRFTLRLTLLFNFGSSILERGYNFHRYCLYFEEGYIALNNLWKVVSNAQKDHIHCIHYSISAAKSKLRLCFDFTTDRRRH